MPGLDVANKEIRYLRVENEPRPTYRMVIEDAFEKAGFRVVIAPSKTGIDVAYLFRRSFRLKFGTIAQWKRKGIWNAEGLRAEMKRKGWQFSEHFSFVLLEQSASLVVEGLPSDLDKIARFLGQ